MKQSIIPQDQCIFQTPKIKQKPQDQGNEQISHKFIQKTQQIQNEKRQSNINSICTIKKKLFQKSGVSTPPSSQNYVTRESRISKPSVIQTQLKQKQELKFKITDDEPFQQLKILNDMYSDDEIKILSFKEFGLEEKVIKCLCHKYDKKTDQYNCILQCQLLKNEYEICKLFEDNPFIIQQFEYKENESERGLADQISIPCCYIIMEKAPYGDLYSQSLKNTEENGLEGITFKVNYFKSIFIQTIHALECLHKQKVSHNDIKLDNIYVFDFDEDEQRIYVKLADFGYANTDLRKIDRKQQFDLFEFKNPDYSSPEIRSLYDPDNHDQDPIDEYASDIYNLGQTMLEAFTGIEFNFNSKAHDMQRIFNKHDYDYFQRLIKQKYLNKKIQTKNHKLKEEWDNKTKQIFKIIFNCLKSDPQKRPDLQILKKQFANL